MSCDCNALSLPPIHYTIDAAGDCDCQKYGVVSIDDVPCGTGRLDERGNIVDVEWDATSLAKLGLNSHSST